MGTEFRIFPASAMVMSTSPRASMQILIMSTFFTMLHASLSAETGMACEPSPTALDHDNCMTESHVDFMEHISSALLNSCQHASSNGLTWAHPLDTRDSLFRSSPLSFHGKSMVRTHVLPSSP